MLKPETIHVLVGRLVLENLSLQDEVAELQKSLGSLKDVAAVMLSKHRTLVEAAGDEALSAATVSSSAG